jgi:hypothetical protein
VVDADQGEVAEIDATVEVEVAPKNDRSWGQRCRDGDRVERRRQALTAASRSSDMWLLTK